MALLKKHPQPSPETLAEAGRILFENNPLSAITGCVCPKFCKKACILNHKNNPVDFSIIEREISKTYLSMRETEPRIRATNSRVGATSCRPLNLAVVGSGPAGIAFAYYAARDGHRVTMYERGASIGGTMRYGIPNFRLDKTLIDRIETILLSMGVEIVKNKSVDLHSVGAVLPPADHIIVAIGAWKSRRLGFAREECALNFLKEMNSSYVGATNNRTLNDRTFVIIGGGNVAIDCAMVARHYGATALLCYRKGEAEMKAGKHEIQLAKKMGVKFRFNMTPTGTTKKSAIFMCDGKKTYIKCDRIISAIGQAAEINIEATENIHPIGDMVTGTRTIIEAVASAKVLYSKLNGSN